MKEKRILAMFITAAITLVASLSITFGVLTTLADPVVATGVTRYAFAFGAENNGLVVNDENVLKFKDTIVFQPSNALVCSDEDWDVNNKQTVEPVIINDDSNEETESGYLCTILFADESISTKVKVIPLRISNDFETDIIATVNVKFDKTTLLGKYTQVKVYDFQSHEYKAGSVTSFSTNDIAVGGYADYAIVVYVDDSYNTSDSSVNFGTDYESINIEVRSNID